MFPGKTLGKLSLTRSQSLLARGDTGSPMPILLSGNVTLVRQAARFQDSRARLKKFRQPLAPLVVQPTWHFLLFDTTPI